jgi:hypothetical protein
MHRFELFNRLPLPAASRGFAACGACRLCYEQQQFSFSKSQVAVSLPSPHHHQLLLRMFSDLAQTATVTTTPERTTTNILGCKDPYEAVSLLQELLDNTTNNDKTDDSAASVLDAAKHVLSLLVELDDPLPRVQAILEHAALQPDEKLYTLYLHFLLKQQRQQQLNPLQVLDHYLFQLLDFTNNSSRNPKLALETVVLPFLLQTDQWEQANELFVRYLESIAAQPSTHEKTIPLVPILAKARRNPTLANAWLDLVLQHDSLTISSQELGTALVMILQALCTGTNAATRGHAHAADHRYQQVRRLEVRLNAALYKDVMQLYCASRDIPRAAAVLRDWIHDSAIHGNEQAKPTGTYCTCVRWTCWIHMPVHRNIWWKKRHFYSLVVIYFLITQILVVDCFDLLLYWLTRYPAYTQNLAEKRGDEIGEGLFHHMLQLRDKGVIQGDPTSDTYANRITCLLISGNIVRATRVLYEMQDLYSKKRIAKAPRADLYHRVLDAWRRSNHPERDERMDELYVALNELPLV